jgi:[amino group carrier protein]-lysine/ornithine hydrolase
MLRIPSLCGQEDELADLLVTTMEEAGFQAHRDEVGNVIGTVLPSPLRPAAGHGGTGLQGVGRGVGGEGAAQRVVILGHMDTVPGSIAVKRRDGTLYGRGAVDAKGPLATAMVAATRAAGSSRCEISVIGAVQEEGPSVGARHLSRCPVPNYLVIAEPSGWDAVVLGYKGSQRFTVEFTQPSAHTAGSEPSAPERAVDFWHKLVGWCAEQASGDGAPVNQFGRLTATLIGMASESDGLHDTASLHVGLRLPPGLSCRQVQDGVRALLPEEASCRFAAGEEAVRSRKDTPLVASFLRSIRSEGGKPRFKVKTGTSDMNVVGPAWNCPMLAYGPGDSRLDHTPNEHIVVEEYLQAIRVFTAVLQEL